MDWVPAWIRRFPLVAAMAVLGATGGCRVGTPVSPGQISPESRTRLSSPAGVVLRQRVRSDSSAALRGEVRRLEADFVRLDGDTLHLARVHVLGDANLPAAWDPRGPALLLLSENPRLRSEVLRRSAGRTVRVVGIGVAVVVVALLWELRDIGAPWW